MQEEACLEIILSLEVEKYKKLVLWINGYEGL